MVEVIPGLLAWVLVTYNGLLFRCWNIYAVPQRKSEVLHALLQECRRLRDLPGGDDGALDIFAGDLNVSPLRETDAKLYDVATAALQLRYASFASLQDGASQGTFRNAHGPHWIDHAGGVEAREGETCLQWRLRREQPETVSGHHAPLRLVGSLRQRRVCPKNRWPALPTHLFIDRRGQCSGLVCQLSKVLTNGGLPLDVLTARRRAYTDTSGVQGEQALLGPAQTLADACTLGQSPLRYFSTMESQVHAWAKRTLASERTSPAEVVRRALRTGREARVPADAWRCIHRQLGVQPVGRPAGDVYVVNRGEAESILAAYGALMDGHEAPLRCTDAADTDQVRRYHKIFPKVRAYDERLDTDAGLTDDPRELDRLYSASRSFWYRSPECDYVGQSQHLLHYIEHVVGEGACVDVALPDVAELHHVVVNTPDSSPGYGGVPFAAWRLISLGVAMLLRCFFRELLRDGASALEESPLRHQLIRWIPKKVAGYCASARRPLGVSASFFRLVNATLHRIFQRCLRPRMHPAQAIFREDGEALTAVAHMQDYLDEGHVAGYCHQATGTTGGRSSATRIVEPWLAAPVGEPEQQERLRLVSLSDFNKAFERISPLWIMLVLCAWGVPLWLAILAAFFLYDRVAHLYVGSWVGPGRRVLSGVDMGGNASSAFYCLGLDPLLWLLTMLPDIAQVEAYMDDLAAAGGLWGTAWFQAALRSFESVVPFVIDHHTCWSVCDGDGWCSVASPFSGLAVTGTRVRHVISPAGRQYAGTWAQLAGVPFDRAASCTCSCKLRIIPHREPTNLEVATLLRMSWGAACVTEAAVYLGIMLTAHRLWSAPRPLDIQLHRAQLSFAEPIRKMSARVDLLQHIRLNPSQRSTTWVVYVQPLLSYVSQHCWVYGPVLAQILKLLVRHMKCSWWLSAAHLQCFRVWSGKAIAPQLVAAVCAGYYVARWCRVHQGLWLYTLHESNASELACEAVMRSIVWAKDDRCTRQTAKVLLALDGPAASMQWPAVGRAVRIALDELHAAQHEDGFLQKAARWPGGMQAPVVSHAYRHAGHSYTQIFTMMRWLFNAVPTGRRRRHWTCNSLRPLQCELCGSRSNVVPVTKRGELGVCYGHLMEVANDSFAASGWHAYVHLARLFQAHEARTAEGGVALLHPVAQALIGVDGWTARPATVASVCVACGFSDDSLEHRFFACPVMGQAWEIAFGDDQVAWTGRTCNAPSLLAFFQVAHLWFAARAHVDAASVENTEQSWRRSARSLLQQWWDALPTTGKIWEVASRLMQYGVRLSRRRATLATSQDHAILSEQELQELAAVPRSFYALVRALERVSTHGAAPCSDCLGLWRSAVQHSVVPVRVGPGVVAQAGCSDYRMQRWGVATAVSAGSLLYSYLRDPEGNSYQERPVLAPRTVQLGTDYTARTQVKVCSCGWSRSEVRAACDMAAGTELVALHEGAWDPQQCHLVVTADGGGKWIEDRPCFGAGLVAFVYAAGAAHRLAELALPLYSAESAQEAEAAAGWEAVMWRGEALRLARAKGFTPLPPDVLYGDSANTAGALDNRVRLRAAAPNRWAAGMREVTATHTRDWVVVAVPRSMNKAADGVATVAWQIVRDVRESHPQLTVFGTGGGADVALSATYSWTQVLIAFRNLRDAHAIEASSWRSMVAEHCSRGSYAQRPLSSIDEALPPLEWTACRLDWSHAALFYALVVMLPHGNRMGQRLYRAWKLQQAHDVSRSSEGSGWLFTWYATADGTGRGRAQERTPGVLSIPRPLRSLLLVSWHVEYDLASCHLSALACVLTAAEAPVLHYVLQAMGGLHRQDLLADVPGGKRSLLVPLNCCNLLDPNGEMQGWIRGQERTYIVYGLIGAAAASNGEYRYRSRSRYCHAHGSEIRLRNAQWELVLCDLGVCFTHAVDGRTSLPMGQWTALTAAHGSCQLSYVQSTVPDWYRRYVEELHDVTPVAIVRLEMQGYHGMGHQTEHNIVFHHTAQVAARVVRLALQRLRATHTLFSHALVHDALIIDSSVATDEVVAAFHAVTEALGLPGMHVAQKEWTMELAVAQDNLRLARYHPGAVLPQDARDTYDETRALHRYAPRNLFDTQQRVGRRPD